MWQGAQVQAIFALLGVLLNGLGSHGGPFRGDAVDEEVDPAQHELLPEQLELVVGIGSEPQQGAVVGLLDHVLDVAKSQEIDRAAGAEKVRGIDGASTLSCPLPINDIDLGLGGVPVGTQTNQTRMVRGLHSKRERETESR